ncbi:hypothetical protein [Inquilinus sp.]|uniref:hypothetical protein n=1 Tax=Inquilinus sp. TaxID=1932117 RepID=UPI0031D6A034
MQHPPLFRAAAIALALAAGTASAQADDAQQLAAKGAELLKAGQPEAAFKALNDAATEAWLQSPLSFRHTLLVSAPAQSYGAYSPRESNVFDGDTPLRFYAEPTGFGWVSDGELYRIDLSIDFSLRSADGKPLGEQKDFQNFKIESRERVREMFFNLSLTLNGAPDGQYIVTFTMHDHATGKDGAFDVPFEIKHG